jgi:hypothetical protein
VRREFHAVAVRQHLCFFFALCCFFGTRRQDACDTTATEFIQGIGTLGFACVVDGFLFPMLIFETFLLKALSSCTHNPGVLRFICETGFSPRFN